MNKYTAYVQHGRDLSSRSFPLPTGFYDIYIAPDVDWRIAEMEKVLRDCIESMVGYRRELPHPTQQCDAERAARELLGL